ncbi:Gfo/Idh/MocA family protein [Ahrensia marina]|uniref:Oxidoreductase n=1 Tax=Ahrensia marina TaxID=1514904 RepID=A0A0N0E8W4_9HYPH|nr:Gfo/Idh/MocA family oxidoreductase [Ahrensia marina]KPB02722.1 oxidoreductase [Ahrensia marina]
MTNTTDRKRVVIIGAGMVAKTHLLALADLSEKVELAGVLTRSQNSARKFADEARELLGYGVQTFDAVAQVASDASIDFAIVLTPPNARKEIVKELAEAGKHILMEKPVERKSAAAGELVDLCEAQNVKLGIVFQHRVRESSVKLKSLMNNDTFGKLHIAEARIPWWREQAYYDEPGRGTYARDGGGVLISQAIHTLDLLLSLTGAADKVQAMARTSALHKMESEDYVSAGVDYKSGAIGSIVASTAIYPGEAESLSFQFEKAAVTLQSGMLTIKWRDGREESIGEAGGTGGGADPMAFTHDWHRGIIEDFVDALNGDHAPVCSGREALKVHYLIDAIVQSSAEKCAVDVQSN